jgi:hypothetical protein
LLIAFEKIFVSFHVFIEWYCYVYILSSYISACINASFYVAQLCHSVALL